MHIARFVAKRGTLACTKMSPRWCAAVGLLLIGCLQVALARALYAVDSETSRIQASAVGSVEEVAGGAGSWGRRVMIELAVMSRCPDAR